jgi:hypothetical protein
MSEHDPWIDYSDDLGAEARALLDFLVDRPLATRSLRNDRERRLWAMRDLRAAVYFELRGGTPAPRLTLSEVDQLLRQRRLSDRVWDRLVTRHAREEIPLD